MGNRTSRCVRRRRCRSFFAAVAYGCLAIAVVGPLSCSRDGTSLGGSVTGVVRTLEGRGIPSARLDLVGGTPAPVARLTDSTGAFEFADVDNGTYAVELRLPAGFEPVPSGANSAVQNGVLIASSVEVSGAPRVVDLVGRAVTNDTADVAPGAIDTLATSSGAIVIVDASAAVTGVTITVDASPTTSFDSLGGAGKPLFLQLRPSAGVAGTASAQARVSHAPGQANAAGHVAVRIAQDIGNALVSSVRFVLNVGTESQPLYLWSNATSTTYTDSRTGVSKAVALYTGELDAGLATDAWITTVRADDDCTTGRELRLANPLQTPDANKIPLILIHGLQLAVSDCEQVRNFDPVPTFRNVIDAIDPDIRSKYDIYVLRYPTFARVLATSDFLWNELQRLHLRQPVLVGHSMGGLVGRGLLATHPDGDVRALLTLATPHEGSALANGASQSVMRDCFWPGLKEWGVNQLGGLLPETNGIDDIRPDGEFINRLKLESARSSRVLTLAGQRGWNSGSVDLDYVKMRVMGCVLNALSPGPSDGVVTVSSATPSWTALQTLVSDHDHWEMGSGSATGTNDPALFDRVNAVLKSLALATACVPSPAPPTVNDFPLSGSVARVNGTQVDVTLNPIVVGGVPVTDPSTVTFKIIENGCVLPATVSTSSGSVGVDIAFVQDLSSSMSSAIAGVRSSVVAFAADLASRGLNVRVGSVGYSGAGTIPSTPATSTCEYLGPVRDLTDASTFQAHVQSSWLATAGCDTPENGLEAIEYAHNMLTWRAGAVRVYIDITDTSHHTATTNCNGLGACTDETLTSIVALVGSTSTIHAVAPATASYRTANGGLDPWLLADATGGQKLSLGSGTVNLTTLGIADAIGQVTRLTFESVSQERAYHRLRIRVEVNGKVAELSPGLIQYSPRHASLTR